MFPALYAILDSAVIAGSIAGLAENLASAGVRLMQLRDKRSSARQLCQSARELARHLRSHGARLILNDRPDIAAVSAVGGVHVGQGDLPAEEARLICGPGVWVGVSTHNIEQLRAAARTSADYIAVGPLFPTSSKQNPDPVVGLDFLRVARRETRKPLVGIGVSQ